MNKLLLIVFAVLLFGCGVSEQERIAADRGCSLAKSYKAIKENPKSPGALVFRQAKENFVLNSKDVNMQNVEATMKKLCPDDIEVFPDAAKYTATE